MRLISLFCLAASATAFSTPTVNSRQGSTVLDAVNRKDFLQAAIFSSAAGLAILPANAGEVVTLSSGVSYEILKSGDGPKPDRGELAAIRFAAYAGKNKIDDIFDTPEPYYTRIGSGSLLKVRVDENARVKVDEFP